MPALKPALTRPRPKTWTIAAIPLTITGLVIALIVVPWSRRLDLLDPQLAFLCRLSAAIWSVVLLWALHQLTFQLGSLFTEPPATNSRRTSVDTSFVVVYLTCDDFQWRACRSCLDQDYPSDQFQVLICDDSHDPAYKREVDAFCAEHPNARLIRRLDRFGFKAGNLNHALHATLADADEWVVIVDADQRLPREYLRQMSSVIATQADDVGFVQGSHRSDHHAAGSTPSDLVDSQPFQQNLGVEIEIFYERDLPLREQYGFLPFLGHGGAVRGIAWRRMGGFPPVVSEDYAFSLRNVTMGYRGVYAPAAGSLESFPRDFASLTIRLRKFAGGSAELLRSEVPAFIAGPATALEKFDFLMLLLWYPLMPFLVANGFLSAYVCHRLWTGGFTMLHPALPYLFVSMFLLSIPVVRSATKGALTAWRYWSWATAIYGSLLPITAWAFVRHLASRPTFVRTPKGGERPRLPLLTTMVLMGLGVLALIASWQWLSPFSPVLAAQGTCYASFGLYSKLNDRSRIGALARVIVLLPGVLFISALVTMWTWSW